MSRKPIFVATHPRSISTAFERVFMTQRETITTEHEPFSDAYYYGPERLAERYANDEEARRKSGFTNITYKDIMNALSHDDIEGKRILIKDMAQYLIPPNGKPVSIAPSVGFKKQGIGTRKTSGSATPEMQESLKTEAQIFSGIPTPLDSPYLTYAEPDNPTVIPCELLQQFHFAFLIRHPRYSIPSYYRCCSPPLSDMTGFHNFRTDEAGYVELHRLFDFLLGKGMIGPRSTGSNESFAGGRVDDEPKLRNTEICVIDADDLLDKPARVIETFCNSVGIQYHPDMLKWDSPDEEAYAAKVFEKWKGFHEDVIHSRDLRPRGRHDCSKSMNESHADWVAKYGEAGAAIIHAAVEENVEHYEYLKQFCIKV